MKKLRLRDPEILERDNSVLVVIRHETLASPEQTVVEYLRSNATINNATARQITGMPSEIKMRAVFKKLMKAGEIEQVPDTHRSTTQYRLPQGAAKKPKKPLTERYDKPQRSPGRAKSNRGSKATGRGPRS